MPRKDFRVLFLTVKRFAKAQRLLVPLFSKQEIEGNGNLIQYSTFLMLNWSRVSVWVIKICILCIDPKGKFFKVCKSNHTYFFFLVVVREKCARLSSSSLSNLISRVPKETDFFVLEDLISI